MTPWRSPTVERGAERRRSRRLGAENRERERVADASNASMNPERLPRRLAPGARTTAQ